MAQPPQHIRFCKSCDGVRIAYAIGGNGPPLLRAPHPISHLDFDWESPVWRPLLSALARRHTLVRYDMRGCGLSDRNDVDFSFEKYVQDLEAVIEAAALQRVILFGMDGGGATAIAYAARHPEKVSCLVLLGCYSRARLARNPTQRQIEETELQLKAFELGFECDNPGLRSLYGSIRLPDSTSEQFRSFADLTRLATTPANAVALWRVFFRVDLQDIAPKVQCPTLVLHAREDAAIPFDEGRLLAGLIPGAHFVPLESRNHLLSEAEPAWSRFAEELDRFLPAMSSGKAALASLSDLTARENEVLELLAQGLDNETIAKKLGISEKTVRNQVSIIFSKLNVNSRAQAVVRARDAGFGLKSAEQVRR